MTQISVVQIEYDVYFDALFGIGNVSLAEDVVRTHIRKRSFPCSCCRLTQEITAARRGEEKSGAEENGSGKTNPANVRTLDSLQTQRLRLECSSFGTTKKTFYFCQKHEVSRNSFLGDLKTQKNPQAEPTEKKTQQKRAALSAVDNCDSSYEDRGWDAREKILSDNWPANSKLSDIFSIFAGHQIRDNV